MDDSLFGKLSPELRNTVYELVLVNSAHIHIKARRNSDTDRAVTRMSGDDSERLDVALLRACKQIHQEATSILYHDNKFNFTNEQDDSASAFENFTMVIGPQNANMLRTCFIVGGASQLVPTEYNDQHKQLKSWGKKVLNLSAQLPKCRISGILRFKVDDTQSERVDSYEIDLSSPHDLFISQLSGAVKEASRRALNVINECKALHYNDPRIEALGRLGDRTFVVSTALSDCFGDLGRHTLGIRKQRSAMRKQKLKQVKQRRRRAFG
ncbi:hypothetical protein HII31_01891 [Pseudocercospora fuligena]|uniref:DUF7730 domain-containing protein n=1 Tax=Pseudocercospora fuligena TaxID=685502 RepID=A0A8H6VNH1_9PEZI|nr:hypothetical protein HII31_01891 [Pseudocercospora fuligena]